MHGRFIRAVQERIGCDWHRHANCRTDKRLCDLGADLANLDTLTARCTRLRRTVEARRSSAPAVDPAAAALAPSAAGGQVVVAPDAHLDPCGVLVPLSTEDLARARTRLQPFLAKMDGLLCKTGGTCYTAHPVVLLPPELDVNPLTVRTVRELHGVAQLSRFYNRMSREQTALWLAAMEHTAPCNVDRADVNEDGFFLTEALKNPKPGRKKKPPLFGLPHALFRCTGDAALVLGHGYGADVERVAAHAPTEEGADQRLRRDRPRVAGQ